MSSFYIPITSTTNTTQTAVNAQVQMKSQPANEINPSLSRLSQTIFVEPKAGFRPMSITGHDFEELPLSATLAVGGKDNFVNSNRYDMIHDSLKRDPKHFNDMLNSRSWQVGTARHPSSTLSVLSTIDNTAQGQFQTYERGSSFARPQTCVGTTAARNPFALNVFSLTSEKKAQEYEQAKKRLFEPRENLKSYSKY